METKYEDIATALKMRGYRVREFTKAELERGRTVPALRSGLLNADVHGHLIALGYTRTHHEASYEYVGDAETGPRLEGGPEFDEYLSDTDVIVIDHNGMFVHHELRDLEFEKFLDQQVEASNSHWKL